MSRDLIVMVGVVLMVGIYGIYTLGYEKGQDDARKDCPHVTNQQLKFIEQHGEDTRCVYQQIHWTPKHTQVLTVLSNKEQL